MSTQVSSPPGPAAALRLPASLESVGVARGILEGALTSAGWGLAAAGPVMLATGEALANAILHGSMPDGEVCLGVDVSRERARVRVVDHGRPGASCPTGPAELPPIGSTRGRGLYIMRAIADVCDVRPEGGGTQVVLEFLRAA